VTTISGVVNSSGTLTKGSGVTVTHLRAGVFQLVFPAGTFPSFPVVVVTPFGVTGALPAAEVSSITSAGGGATVVVSTGGTSSSDQGFMFTATAS
jgi:hypothetical protein